eukprot:8087450-Lingulodinium_polyedra.AAC.1
MPTYPTSRNQDKIVETVCSKVVGAVDDAADRGQAVLTLCAEVLDLAGVVVNAVDRDGLRWEDD